MPRTAPPSPRLENLHGMPKAVAWGEALAQDIRDYVAGRIGWSELDRGALLHGEPGTGKTIFAKALAITCGVPLIATSYAEWQRAKEGYLGDVLTAMHRRFAEARRAAPCILFIDELDAIPTRAGDGHNQRWWTSVVTALNEELDGISAREGVVVIAAANYPSRIDAALLRAGRLDTKIEIALPGQRDLEGIIRFHLGEDLPGADLRSLAIATVGCTGADIEKFLRGARRQARQHKRDIACDDIFAALEEDTSGIPANLLQRVAIHEAGHAAVAVSLAVSRNVSVSLVRRGQRSAVTFFDPETEAVTRDVIERRMAVALAGRAAEQVLLGDVTAGAGGADTSDLAVANGLAFRAVAAWGLSHQDALRWYGDCPPEQLLAIRPDLAEEVRQMLQGAYNVALELIETRRRQVRAIAQALLLRRALAHEDIAALLEEPPEAPRPERRRRRPA
jgi:cell division protease FtsH